ncbi:hypothetical protein [Amycolatopsis rubida]|uniref:hypothetical protein n=1 Tax=Amycolatopsis rubida TaxID=112413 RepID=UPI0011605A07|nr:hypothetical protein [Amycolatopsis rubida]
MERGEYAGAKTFDAIESALDWPKRSMQAYLDGGPEPTATAPEEPRHEWSASERARMRDMSMAEVQETHDIFRRRSEYLADVWLREVMRVKAEAETKMDSQPNTER